MMLRKKVSLKKTDDVTTSLGCLTNPEPHLANQRLATLQRGFCLFLLS